MQMKRYAELQAESLGNEEEMANAQARVRIYEGENIDQKVQLKTPTMTNIKADESRYLVMMKKQNYLDQNGKLSAVTQFQDRQRVSKFSTTNNQQAQLQNKQHNL